jgi:DNA-binding transcriptional regulator LsrR (DeoR family)
MNEIPGFDSRSVSQELTEKLVLAAELYYIYDLPQKDIAARLGVSRPWVSKLLKRAEEIGIVRIDVNTNTAGISDIEKKLIDKYGLKNAKIVKTSTTDSSLALAQAAHAAAHFLVSIIEPRNTIGIAWGSTLAAMFNQYLPVSFPGVTVVPLVGGIGRNADILSNQLASKLAASLGARYRLLHTPAFVVGKQERETIMNDPATKELIEMTENVDIAILAMSTLDITHAFTKFGYMSRQEYDELVELDVAGDVALRFIDHDGAIANHDAHDKLIAGDLSKTVKHARYTIGFALGQRKVPIIRAALKGKWMNVLISDLETAIAVLDE